ncbi:MAG: hypothetical protein DRK00_06210 [Thermoprotei archaeon]|nr:MAG: hypothetical protein DRK00_06210 [Thermoprotei archaeon]
MVFVLSKWEDLEECVQYARYILYRTVDHGDRIELRVKAGRLGFQGFFRKDNPELKEILEKLRAYGAVKVERTVPDKVFLA